MIAYSSVLRRALMPLYEAIKGKQLLHYLSQYEGHLQWTPEQLESYQWEQLQKLLEHSFSSTAYYQRVWTELGIRDARDIASMDDFRRLPLLTKDDVNKHYSDLLSSRFSGNIRKSTGGSTGVPFSFELNVDSNTRREAVMWRGYGWLGAGLGTKTLYLWGADVGEVNRAKALKTNLYHRFYNRKMLNSFAMTQSNMGSYVDQINQFRPEAIVSYVNPLYELARYINEEGLSVTAPGTILTGAEPLHDFQRSEIEQAFNCQVFDTYGCREFMLVAAECREFGKLHINSDHLVVETLNNEGAAVVGESGDLVVTDLFNYGMPLIRYQNGDNATLVDKPCCCENPLPIMESIDGRKLDVIKTPSGGMIPGELFPHLFKEFSGIRKFQVQQLKLTELKIKIVVGQDYDQDDQRKIEQEINKYSLGELALKFELVDEIPLTASGKHRVTVCEV
ncbi:phenylacetate--CoA ligase family protein [Motiliproteus sp. MSK22-1]|uniref:phenylacetate--CoA ligase family protein n=1 Tax=Motiliproteus sp. MSK22-1 TaxID=1897630 RepID=UPI0009771C5E|nr:phenylacetate--CoA ligase family protein [Motiliproteus sp. MSK22-1]OMH25676.1 polysaccharide biosynthesis protein [Motiliproteus sp. MSK22-1]